MKKVKKVDCEGSCKFSGVGEFNIIVMLPCSFAFNATPSKGG